MGKRVSVTRVTKSAIKYSRQNTSIAGILQPSYDGEGRPQQMNVTVVPAVPSPVKGVRKVRNMYLSLSSDNVPQYFLPISCYWAVVYIPENTSPGTVSVSVETELYQPEQFCLACGVFDPNAGPNRIKIPLSRKLHNGDSIMLLLRNTSDAVGRVVHGVFSYSIAYL